MPQFLRQFPRLLKQMSQTPGQFPQPLGKMSRLSGQLPGALGKIPQALWQAQEKIQAQNIIYFCACHFQWILPLLSWNDELFRMYAKILSTVF